MWTVNEGRKKMLLQKSRWRIEGMSSDRISDVPVTMAGKQSGQDMSIHQEQVPVCRTQRGWRVGWKWGLWICCLHHNSISSINNPACNSLTTFCDDTTFPRSPLCGPSSTAAGVGASLKAALLLMQFCYQSAIKERPQAHLQLVGIRPERPESV